MCPLYCLKYAKNLDGYKKRLICKDGIPLLHSTQYLNYIHSKYRRTSTADTYAVQLLPFFQWMDSEGHDLLGISRIQLQKYLNYLQTRNLSDTTVRQYMGSVLRFIVW
ncbi:site-specific integrase [Brevibacillus fortis]|uniref:site-specific integrase n=1 Tax=Brevibacillus fortis TaxID=2126352 RepID=UPI0038FCC94C